MDITIGKPIANTQIYILDEGLNLMPIGIPGEICIAGEGVGGGYLNRPELTKEKFVPNPFATKENKHGKTLYRSGDLGRMRSDGEIEILGRIDSQVKIRGLRIELGEIENVMSAYPEIGLTAAAAQKDDNGRQYLVGYYTAEKEINENELRKHLAVKLPKYMIPNYFVHLKYMPMTTSGKTDRKQLPLPQIQKKERFYKTPESQTENVLATLWQELLKTERIGKTDDFFESGGDSLLAIALVSRIMECFGKELSVRDIFENTSLEQMASLIEAKENEYDVRLSGSGDDRYELLPQQKAIYIACMKDKNSLVYNVPARLPLPGSTDKEKLKSAIQKVVRRHKVLNTYIEEEGNVLCGKYNENAKLTIEEYDEQDEDSFLRPFDLGRAPLVHAAFAGRKLLIDIHHIVADGRSMSLLIQEIADAYNETAEFKGDAHAEEIWFADYASYFQTIQFDRHIASFRENLKCDFEPVILPQCEEPLRRGDSSSYFLTKELLPDMGKVLQQQGLSETMLYFAAYGILLSKYSGKKNVLTSIIMQNRTNPDTQDMVGMFVNTLPVYMHVSGSVQNYLQTVKETLLNVYRFQEIPFLTITEEIGIKDASVINTSFVYQGTGEMELRLGENTIQPEMIETNTSKFDLTMEVTPSQDGYRMRMEYNREMYDKGLVDRLVNAYQKILFQVTEAMKGDRSNIRDQNEKTRDQYLDIKDINVLSEEELYDVTEGFNDTYVDIPLDKCIHELFSEQVARTPEKVALVFEEKQFTYREIDDMSDALAVTLNKGGGYK